MEIIVRMTDWRMNGRCVYKSTLFKAICIQNIKKINKFVLGVLKERKLQFLAQALGKVG